MTGQVRNAGNPIWASDFKHPDRFAPARTPVAAEFPAVLAFPVLVGTRVVAVLEFFADTNIADTDIQPDADLSQVLAKVGTQLGRVVERKQLERQIANLAIQERRNFGIELHDELGQQLTGISLLANSMLRRQLTDESTHVEKTRELIELIAAAQSDVRQMIRGLRPVEVDAHGLMEALHQLADYTREHRGMKCEFECDRPVVVKDNDTATHLYHIAREAVNNAVKHSHARLVTIRLLEYWPSASSRR